MQTDQQNSRSSALQYLWHGIQAVGGLWPWCLAAGVIGFIVGAAIVAFTAILKQDLSGTLAWTIWKWAFWITVAICAVVTAYLAWNAEPEEDGDEASPQR